MKKVIFCPQCGRKHNGKTKNNLCGKHCHQLKKYGKFLDSNPRTKHDSNDYKILGDTTEVELYSPITWEKEKVFLIDTEDLPIIMKYKWRLSQAGYVRTEGCNSNSLLHRILLRAIPGSTVDHIDRNPLNNKKENLRITSKTISSINRNSYNKLGVKGVEKTRSGKYSAYFRIEGKQYHSPVYNTIEEASFARYILEQLFCNEYILTENADLHNRLSVERKQEILQQLQKHFNV